MEIDPMEPVETQDAANAAHARLNTWVAITVALLATFMGICKVKDDNIVQAMQQAQAAKIDDWSFYQARNIRQEVAQATLVQLSYSRAPDSLVKQYQALVKDQAAKKDSLRKAALAD